MKQALHARPVRHLFIFALAILLISQGAISLFAWSVLEQKIRPELDRKAAIVGLSLTAKITRALDYGIPFDRLVGVEDFFDDVLKENTDIAFLVVTDPSGRVRFASGIAAGKAASVLSQTTGSPVGPASAQTAALATRGYTSGGVEKEFLDTFAPIFHQGKTVGALHVGVDQSFIASRIREVRYDIAIVLLTSMLIAFEIMLFVVARHFSGPMRQIAEMMTRMAGGDFSHRIVISAKEQLGSLGERLNLAAARINQAFASLAQLISRTTVTNPGLKQYAVAILPQISKRYAFAEGGILRDLSQRRIVSIRILTFLFMFAEMLSRPFLPLFTGSFADPGIGLAPDLLASLPITAYLLGVALTMPLAGRWSDRMGRRRSYVAGALIVALGLTATAVAPGFILLLAARTLVGIGYATMFMSCQGFVIDNTDNGNRARGVALFVGAIMVAEICAPAVGGILADRIGYEWVFILGAIVTLIAAVLATRILDNAGARNMPRKDMPPNQSVRLIGNIRFMALSILSGIPAKLLYSGFLIYLVPVLMTEFGSSKSEIGRYAMVYGVVALTLSPVFASIADRYNAHGRMVALGGIITGAGFLPVLWGASPNSVLLGIAALGLGQSMSIAAQLVLVARVTAREAQTMGTTPILGVFRLVERLGAAAGPVITGAIVASFGTVHAMAALGAFGVVSSILFSLIFFFAGTKSNDGGETILTRKGAIA